MRVSDIDTTSATEATMYTYQDQYGWALAPKTNSPVPYVNFWNDFQKTYPTRAAAEKRMAEIWKELGH